MKLSITWLLIFMNIIIQSSTARNIGKPTQSHHHHHTNHYKITFLMKDVFNINVTDHPSSKSATTKQLPFPKPLGFFPPYGGIPISQSNPSSNQSPAGSSSTQTLDVSSNIGLFFPARAAMQELEFGTLMVIDEDLFEVHSVYGSPILNGKAQGIYVANSEDGTSTHMMAMTTTFASNEFKNGLRFFGVHRKDAPESHIAVIGGTGKYNGANGYATVKAVDAGSNAAGKANKVLLFNVYLS